MAGSLLPKMSLGATFDDLIRYSSALMEGNEDELIKIVKSKIALLRQKKLADEEIDRLQKLVAKYQSDASTLELKLKHARYLLEKEINRRNKAESDRDMLERQISLIREVLMSDQNMMNDQTKEKLAFLSNTTVPTRAHHGSPPAGRLETIDESAGSVLSPSEISFDKTDEDLDNPPAHTKSHSKSKRSSSSTRNSPLKKQKSQENGETEIADLQPDEVISMPKTDFGPLYSRSTRSNSEPSPALDALSPPPLTPFRNVCKSDSDKVDMLLYNPLTVSPSTVSLTPSVQRTPSGRTIIPHMNSKSNLKTRAHIFCTKTVLRPETCLPCGRRIKFYKTALKCQDCKSTCHPECKEQMPLPCIPTIQTPNAKGVMGTIADYTPTTTPMIPGLIVHCINEIEDRGLSEIGLYRVPGAEKVVRELKEKFLKGKGVPILTKVDIHTICGVVKDFLRSLQEPLIIRSLWKDFVRAAEMTDEITSTSAIYQAVSQLPQPNRDTLAYVILHLQRIADIPECKMSASNLAKVFGPTVVGFSVPDPAPMDMITETKKQHLVMEKLLSITSDYWVKYASGGEEQNIHPQTPDAKTASQNTLLRSLSGKSQSSKMRKSRSLAMGKVPLTPRNTDSPFSRLARPPRFFASPVLK